MEPGAGSCGAWAAHAGLSEAAPAILNIQPRGILPLGSAVTSGNALQQAKGRPCSAGRAGCHPAAGNRRGAGRRGLMEKDDYSRSLRSEPRQTPLPLQSRAEPSSLPRGCPAAQRAGRVIHQAIWDLLMATLHGVHQGDTGVPHPCACQCRRVACSSPADGNK